MQRAVIDPDELLLVDTAKMAFQVKIIGCVSIPVHYCAVVESGLLSGVINLVTKVTKVNGHFKARYKRRNTK